MGQFIFDNKTRVLFGSGQLGNLHNEVMPGKKALIAISNGTADPLPLSDENYLEIFQNAYR